MQQHTANAQVLKIFFIVTVARGSEMNGVSDDSVFGFLQTRKKQFLCVERDCKDIFHRYRYAGMWNRVCNHIFHLYRRKHDLC